MSNNTFTTRFKPGDIVWMSPSHPMYDASLTKVETIHITANNKISYVLIRIDSSGHPMLDDAGDIITHRRKEEALFWTEAEARDAYKNIKIQEYEEEIKNLMDTISKLKEDVCCGT